MQKQSVYLETTIPSYLTAWPSRDLVTAAHQQVTREWWEARRNDFDLYVSALVVQEAEAGDEDAAARRLAILEGLPLLELTERASEFAHRLVEARLIPLRKVEDALHIATAVVHGMDYLLTWNLSHIANATSRSKIEWMARSLDYEPPTICTPEELLGR